MSKPTHQGRLEFVVIENKNLQLKIIRNATSWQQLDREAQSYSKSEITRKWEKQNNNIGSTKIDHISKTKIVIVIKERKKRRGSKNKKLGGSSEWARKIK